MRGGMLQMEDSPLYTSFKEIRDDADPHRKPNGKYALLGNIEAEFNHIPILYDVVLSFNAQLGIFLRLEQ